MPRNSAADRPADRDRLIEFLRARVGEFDVERDELLQRIKASEPQQADFLRLQWEQTQRTTEVTELQKAVSDAHVLVYHERQKLLAARAENALLQQHTQQARPKSPSKLPRARSPDAMHRSRPGTQAGITSIQGGTVQRKGVQVPRTLDALTERCQVLSQQLQAQQIFTSERIEALLEDRRIREQEAAAATSALGQQLEGTLTRLHTAEENLRTATRDYILAKRGSQSKDCELAIVKNELDACKAQAGAAAGEAAAKQAHQAAAARARHDACMQEYSRSFGKQVQEREAQLADLAAAYEALQQQHSQDVHLLQDALRKARSQAHQLHQRRALDKQGWSNDITLLRRQAAAVDRRLCQMRLKDRLPDDERLDTLLQSLDCNAAEGALAATGQHTLRGKSRQRFADEAVRQHAGVSKGIAALGTRLRDAVQEEELADDEDSCTSCCASVSLQDLAAGASPIPA